MTIMPLDNQLAKNTVRSAEGTTLNTYYALNLSYLKKLPIYIQLPPLWVDKLQ